MTRAQELTRLAREATDLGDAIGILNESLTLAAVSARVVAMNDGSTRFDVIDAVDAARAAATRIEVLLTFGSNA